MIRYTVELRCDRCDKLITLEYGPKMIDFPDPTHGDYKEVMLDGVNKLEPGCIYELCDACADDLMGIMECMQCTCDICDPEDFQAELRFEKFPYNENPERVFNFVDDRVPALKKFLTEYIGLCDIDVEENNHE